MVGSGVYYKVIEIEKSKIKNQNFENLSFGFPKNENSKNEISFLKKQKMKIQKSKFSFIERR